MAINILGPQNGEKPLVTLNVHLDEVLHEVVGILRMTKEEIGNITKIVNENMESKTENTVNDVVHIIHNVKEITNNLASTTGTLYQPIFIIILLIIIILILLIILLFITLKARREYKKQPLKILSKYRKDKNTKIEPQQQERRSTSVLTAAEEGQGPPYPSEKKRNDTLV